MHRGRHVTEGEKAHQVYLALKSAEAAEPQAALPILNGLMGLVRSEADSQALEVEEARSSAFLSICEVGKALHRGQPVASLWGPAIAATERWMALAK
jgi:hypothetical protein